MAQASSSLNGVFDEITDEHSSALLRAVIHLEAETHLR